MYIAMQMRIGKTYIGSNSKDSPMCKNFKRYFVMRNFCGVSYRPDNISLDDNKEINMVLKMSIKPFNIGLYTHYYVLSALTQSNYIFNNF